MRSSFDFQRPSVNSFFNEHVFHRSGIGIFFKCSMYCSVVHNADYEVNGVVDAADYEPIGVVDGITLHASDRLSGTQPETSFLYTLPRSPGCWRLVSAGASSTPSFPGWHPVGAGGANAAPTLTHGTSANRLDASGGAPSKAQAH